MMNASLPPNRWADSSRMSLSVSTLPPLARECAKRLPGTLPIRCVVREQDGLHVKFRQAADGPARQRHIVGEEGVRQCDLALYPLEQVADDHKAVPRRIEADAPGRVAGRVEDTKAAEDRELVAFIDGLRVRRRACQ